VTWGTHFEAVLQVPCLRYSQSAGRVTHRKARPKRCAAAAQLHCQQSFRHLRSLPAVHISVGLLNQRACPLPSYTIGKGQQSLLQQRKQAVFPCVPSHDGTRSPVGCTAVLYARACTSREAFHRRAANHASPSRPQPPRQLILLSIASIAWPRRVYLSTHCRKRCAQVFAVLYLVRACWRSERWLAVCCRRASDSAADTRAASRGPLRSGGHLDTPQRPQQHAQRAPRVYATRAATR